MAPSTAAINQAITAAHEAGGGTAYVPAGMWLTGSVRFQSNVTLDRRGLKTRWNLGLLLSDIIMPGGISGVELAECLTVSRPDIKVLLMSGNSPEPLVIKPGWRFLAKPFRSSDLLGGRWAQEQRGMREFGHLP